MRVAHLFQQAVYVAARTTANGWGEPGYSAPVRRAARVERGDAITPAGEGEQSSITATIATAERIGPEDRVWLPLPGESEPSAEDVADTSKALIPGPQGVAPSVSLGGVTHFYVTKV